MGLNTVLHEKVVSLDSVAHILGHLQVAYAVDRDDSGEGVVHSITPGVGFGHVASHVEVNAISAHDSRLTAVGELGVGHLADESFVCAASHHEVRAVLACRGSGVTHHLDVSGQQSHLCSHFQSVATTVVLHHADVLVVESLVDSDSVATYCCDGASLSLIVVEISRGHNNFLTYLPVHCVLNDETTVSWANGARDQSPCLHSRCSVHRQLAVHAADSLVSEHGLLFAIVTAVHDKC